MQGPETSCRNCREMRVLRLRRDRANSGAGKASRGSAQDDGALGNVIGVLGNVDENVIAFDGNRVDFDAGVGNLDGAASRGIELPAVPWADEHSVIDDAGSERASAMRANVIHGGESAADASHATDFIAAREFLRGSLCGHFGERAEAKFHG